MNSNLIIKQRSTTPLTLTPLNESAGGKTNKYKFSGVFTQCSTKDHIVVNRNNRIYMDTEFLRHLPYLRNSIESNGCILGELDHPEGRFDVQLKEASHKITDLWYDKASSCVMGKLEILDTPNGKIAKELVESGYPLFVSSRAAGDVDPKTHEVQIQQIFTYDIVCTPGFEEARLARLNEQKVSNATMKYLNESVSVVRNDNTKYGVSNKGMSIFECESAIPVNENVQSWLDSRINIDELSKPLLEDEEKTEEFTLPIRSIAPVIVDQSPEKSEKIDASTGTLQEEDGDTSINKADDIISIHAEDTSGEVVPSAGNNEPLSDEEKDANRKLILNIYSETVDDEPAFEDDMFITDNNDEPAEENVEENKTEKETTAEKAADDEPEGAKAEEKADDVKEAAEAPTAEDVVEKELEIKKNEKLATIDADIESLNKLLDGIKTSEAVKESIVRRYPFSISLSDKNFTRFAQLRPKMKKRCADFIAENEIFDIQRINEIWDTPLHQEKRLQENWLKLASKEYIDLYLQQPLHVQNAIEEAAKYIVINTAEECDEFWHNTGIMQQAAQKIQNEEFVRAYKQHLNEGNGMQQSSNPLGYDWNFVKMTEDLMRLD